MKDEITEGPGSHEPTEYHKTPKKAAASGWIGSALEYYDFFIYAQAAALVFPNIFFPKTDPQVAIVAAFATFGVGYVARPIGAFVLGHWGDTHGRKNMLVLCMMMIGASTLLVAFLPTYDQVGLLAPALLVILRLIQGFAVGGEISGASAMIIEHSPFGRRGYYGSFTLQGVQAGQVLAAAVFLPLSAVMSEEAFQSYGWRIPFLLSVVVVIAGLIIRRKVDETPAFLEEESHGEVPAAPIVQAVKESGTDMLRVFCMALLNVVPTTVNTFGATFATNEAYGNDFSTTTYLWISVVGNIIAVVLIPFVGNLSDRIGRRPCMIVGAVGSAVLGYLYLYAIDIAEHDAGLHQRHAHVGRRLPGLQRHLPGVLPGAVPDPDPGHRVRRGAEPGHDGHRVPAGRLRPRGAARIERAAHRRDLGASSSGSSRLAPRTPRGRPTGCT